MSISSSMYDIVERGNLQTGNNRTQSAKKRHRKIMREVSNSIRSVLIETGQMDESIVTDYVHLICSLTGQTSSGSVCWLLKSTSLNETPSKNIPIRLAVSDVKWRISLPQSDIVIYDMDLMNVIFKRSRYGQTPTSISLIQRATTTNPPTQRNEGDTNGDTNEMLEATPVNIATHASLGDDSKIEEQPLVSTRT